MLVAIGVNVWANQNAKHWLDLLPIIGLAVWAVILVTAPLRRPDWNLLGENFKGTIFLLALVTCGEGTVSSGNKCVGPRAGATTTSTEK